MKKDKSKKLTLNKETLRDLMAGNAREVKGGAKTNGKKCGMVSGAATLCGGFTCPTYVGCTNTCGGLCSVGCW
jgi:hypothetical protein